MSELDDLLGSFAGISLKRLDEQAALLRRVDNKYAVTREPFLEMMRWLREDHVVLDIDGRRTFGYFTTYFDTPELRCFVDHVEDRVPRFKARTRLYRDSGECVFEVKLKRSEHETDKRQMKYSPDDRERLTDSARSCLEEALRDAGLDIPRELEASLTTAFDRVTFAARNQPERLTCDLGVRLSSPDGRTAEMIDDLVLIETKTEHGESPADRELARRGVEPISLSKYRVGMSMVGPATDFGSQPGSEFFRLTTR
jgi:VTC domain-containing protein